MNFHGLSLWALSAKLVTFCCSSRKRILARLLNSYIYYICATKGQVSVQNAPGKAWFVSRGYFYLCCCSRLSRAVMWCMTKAEKWQQSKSWSRAIWQCMNATASTLQQVRLVVLYRLWMWSKCCTYHSLSIWSIKHCSYFTQFCTWCKVNRKSDLVHLLKTEK